MTLPIILYIFNESSYIVLLANLLVVPLIPLAMLLTFIAGLAGMLVPMIAGWLAWPANLLLTYLLDVAGLVARIPGMQFTISLGVVGLIVMYAVILFIAFIWWQKLSENAKVTETNYLE